MAQMTLPIAPTNENKARHYSLTTRDDTNVHRRDRHPDQSYQCGGVRRPWRIGQAMGHEELQWLKSRFHLKEIRYPQQQRYHGFGKTLAP